MSTVGHTMQLGGTPKADGDVVAMNARERIDQVENELRGYISSVLKSLKEDTGLSPTDIDIEMISIDASWSRDLTIGKLKLRF